MSFACWVTKATDTCLEYVIIVHFPWQQWLCKHTSILRYTYVAGILTLPVFLHFKISTGSVVLMVTGFGAEVVPLVILDTLVTCYLAWQHCVTFSGDMLKL